MKRTIRDRLADPVHENPYLGNLTERQLRHVIQESRLEIDRLRILLAWEAGELSTGQACKALNTHIVEARDYRLRQLAQLRRDMSPEPPEQKENA